MGTYSEELKAKNRNISILEDVMRQASTYGSPGLSVFKAHLEDKRRELRIFDDPWNNNGRKG
jgi:hypothetical protein